MQNAFIRTLALALMVAGPALAEGVPAGYPADYAAKLKAARAEGSLLIYSNMGDDNWRPVIAAFEAAFPGITVENLEMGPAEVFSRYRAETATGIASADLMVAGSVVDWIHASDEGMLSDYTSVEAGHLPGWSHALPGVYTFSADPMVTIFNTVLVPEDLRADTMEGYFANITAHPEVFDGKVGSYDGRYAFGGSINYAFVRKHGDAAWTWFEAAGPLTRPGGGAGGMIEKTLTGELTSAFFVSGASLFPKLTGATAQMISWTFPKDGTPVFLRGMGIAAKAGHPAAAEVFLDFLLSEAGQKAIAEGGLTAYRPGVIAEGETRYSLDEVIAAIGGAENMILIDYDRAMLADEASFTARWAAAFKM
ncbi:ABC transporter substrate-binding protein [Xinfangfangia pollutisoli]|uniref:ABC transporter substrate-binding protein n=1 Tax=Xinfangfangia pollutisoli TaxID=2865960 RepID=UPI001CD77528|nr:extracellular solute-binding protein [Xinfangfangia pollutisoli]